HLAQSNRRINRTNMDQPPSLHTMYPAIAINRACMVELQDKIAITQLEISSLRWISKLGGLPRLPLVLTQVLHNKRSYVVDREQPLARSVYGKASQITGNPTPIKLF